MITIDPKLFVDTVFGINAPDLDKDFLALGRAAGSRCKPIPLDLGKYLLANVPASLIHIEFYAGHAVIWDTDDWDMASHGHAKRMAARAESRAAMNASIEIADMIQLWCDNLMDDIALKSYGRAFWMAKLTSLKDRDGILTAKELVENLGYGIHTDKEYFLQPYGTTH